MVDIDRKDDEDEEVAAGATNKRTMSSAWKVIVLVLLLLIGVAVGTLYYSGVFVSDTGQAVTEDVQEEDEADKLATEQDEPVDEDIVQKQAIYIPIDPSFVVNLEGTRKVRFLQITVEVMTRDEKAVDSIRVHMPVIRNNLTFLFSSRTVEDISSIQGKEKLRADALKEVQKILEEETGEASVEALYFTSFVTQ